MAETQHHDLRREVVRPTSKSTHSRARSSQGRCGPTVSTRRRLGSPGRTRVAIAASSPDSSTAPDLPKICVAITGEP
jgi:hypothetical protein